MRYDPITNTVPVPTAPQGKGKKGGKNSSLQSAPIAPSETALSRNVLRIPEATFACLLGSDDVKAARTARTAFAAWCAVNGGDETEWRRAWHLYHSPAAAAAQAAHAPAAKAAAVTAVPPPAASPLRSAPSPRLSPLANALAALRSI